MRLPDILAMEDFVTKSCNCALDVGSPVTWDGGTSRGVIVRKSGRRVTIQVQDFRGGVGYRNGYRLTKDRSFVHPLGKGPGE
jgi:hypothetical protein